MTRLQVLLEALGQALCEGARKPLSGQGNFGDCLLDVARLTLAYLQKHMPSDDVRHALAEVASAKPDEYARRLHEMIEGLARVQSVPFRAELADYLGILPNTVRHMYRRPSDPTGRTTPEKIEFYKAENLLVFLPPRRPRFRPGDGPAHLDNWRLSELRGIGECGEVWLGQDPAHPERPPAALKFAVDPEAQERIVASQALFVAAFDLNDINGVVPLRSVYLDCNPPCLESAFVYGYDLSGLMHEWKWRFGDPKPEAALKIVRRLAEILAKAHKKKMVHRDLKPSNVLIHPTEGGKYTAWVTDFGWGQIEAARSLELARGGTPRGEQTRLSHHGAYTPLYASPQQQKREAADPRDDVYAIGVIAYQLVLGDLTPTPDPDAARELRALRIPAELVSLIVRSVTLDPERRPKDATEWETTLAALMKKKTVSGRQPAAPEDASKNDATEELGALGESAAAGAAVSQRLTVSARGRWYSRPAGEAGAGWRMVATTPAEVRVSPGEVYRFSINSAATEADVTAVRALASLTGLCYLNLSYCDGVTDAALADLKAFPGLRQLFLRGCGRVTDAGLLHLHALTALLTLELTDCKRLTAYGTAALRKALPTCKVQC